MTKNTIFLFLIISYNSFAQCEEIIKTISKANSTIIFKKVHGKFVPSEYEYENVNVEGNIRRFNYGYKFSSKIDLYFYYPKNEGDSSCNFFTLNGQKIRMVGRFENDFSCDLDINSFQVFRGDFNKRKYLLLTSINNGSGGFTTTIIFHLLDITDKRKIQYYPLWSRYGSVKCLGDFNNDGILDFVKIRNNEKQTGADTFKASIMSLDITQNKFKDIPQSKEWLFKRSYDSNNKIKINIL